MRALTRSRAAAAALLVVMTAAAAHAQSEQPRESGPGPARVIPLPSRDTQGGGRTPETQAPRGRSSEPSDRLSQRDEPRDFSPRHSRRNSQREELEYERERWRDERDTRRREPAGERAGRRRDEPRNARQPGNAAPQAERPGADFGAAAAATPIWLDRACSPDRDERVAAYLAAIEQRTKPTGDQVREFDALKKAAETAGGLLRGACEIAPALTPTRQIEVVERRAKAVLSAIDALKPALETFYATLDDEQKARFNALPAAPAAGAAPSAAPRATPPPQANSTPSDRVGALQRTYGDGADAESEAGGASEEASQPRRKTRRYRSYRWYYRW